MNNSYNVKDKLIYSWEQDEIGELPNDLYSLVIERITKGHNPRKPNALIVNEEFPLEYGFSCVNIAARYIENKYYIIIKIKDSQKRKFLKQICDVLHLESREERRDETDLFLIYLENDDDWIMKVKEYFEKYNIDLYYANRQGFKQQKKQESISK